MTQCFQFSLGRLLVAIALFALSLWMLQVARDSPENGAAATAAFPIMLGSAIGSLFRRAGVGAMAVIVIYCLLGWLLFQLQDDPLIQGRRRGVFERRRFSVVSADEYAAANPQAARKKLLPAFQTPGTVLSRGTVSADDDEHKPTKTQDPASETSP